MRRRFEIGLVVATLAHVAIVASMRVNRAPSPNTASRSAAPIEVTMEDTPPEPPPPPASASRSDATAKNDASRALRPPTGNRHPSSPSPEPSTATPDSTDAVVTAAPSASAPSAWSYVFKNGAPPSSVVGDSKLYANAPPSEAEMNKGANPAANMKASMHARDVELGMTWGGAVLSPTEQSTRLSRAPVNGFGVLVARFGPDGVVLDVHVVDDSGDREAWDEVAKDIAESMRSKRVQVPRGANGIEVTIRVDSRWQLPDGSDPDPYKVCIAGLPCNAGPHRRVVTLSPLGIGAPIPTSGGGALRVVHARIVGERAM